ncbi:hypothetical protein ACIA8E_13345 [Streptomyces sp. NPDC051664]|uniref:hypothetical protein n=1 Tax=Streptomyces sp. NPDC051664 TaxID=3365668 RepID=UPI0037AF56F3
MTFLAALDQLDPQRIGTLGIGASGGHRSDLPAATDVVARSVPPGVPPGRGMRTLDTSRKLRRHR